MSGSHTSGGRLGAVFALLGAVLLTGAGFAWSRARGFEERALEVEGEVVAMLDAGDFNTIPVVFFRSADGKVHRVRGSLATSPPRYRVGERVSILYDPGDPREVSVGGPGERRFPAWLLGGLGLVFAAVGGGILARRPRRRDLLPPRAGS